MELRVVITPEDAPEPGLELGPDGPARAVSLALDVTARAATGLLDSWSSRLQFVDSVTRR